MLDESILDIKTSYYNKSLLLWMPDIYEDFLQRTGL